MSIASSSSVASRKPKSIGREVAFPTDYLVIQIHFPKDRPPKFSQAKAPIDNRLWGSSRSEEPKPCHNIEASETGFRYCRQFGRCGHALSAGHCECAQLTVTNERENTNACSEHERHLSCEYALLRLNSMLRYSGRLRRFRCPHLRGIRAAGYDHKGDRCGGSRMAGCERQHRQAPLPSGTGRGSTLARRVTIASRRSPPVKRPARSPCRDLKSI
jgi:hypothetical protein